MKTWMKKMALIGAILFAAGIGVTSLGAAVGGASAVFDLLMNRRMEMQQNDDWEDYEPEEIFDEFDDSEEMPYEEEEDEIDHEPDMHEHGGMDEAGETWMLQEVPVYPTENPDNTGEYEDVNLPGQRAGFPYHDGMDTV